MTKPMTQLSMLANAVIVFSTLTFLGMGTADGVRAAEKPLIPDFTQGGKKDENHDWTLGPTGVRGWVYGRQGHTAEARQILV